jgi:hypothetical protein
MEAAYNAGQDSLAGFLTAPRAHRGKRERSAARRPTAPAIDWHADEADETGVDGDLEADDAARQDCQPHPVEAEQPGCPNARPGSFASAALPCAG